jgi:MYXO-CTERM domain-containing protein
LIANQEETSAESLVPPRPNLGPEPWPDSPRWPGAAGWWGVGLALICLLILWRRRRRKTRPAVLVDLETTAIDPDSSPRQRLIASSEVIRSALIGTFGPAWGSKTTEEIDADPTLLERFEEAEIDRLVAFLKSADRAKFASAEPELVDDWEEWTASFVSGLAAGATSRSIGK